MKKVIFTGLSIMSLFLLIACGEKETKQDVYKRQRLYDRSGYQALSAFL